MFRKLELEIELEALFVIIECVINLQIGYASGAMKKTNIQSYTKKM